MQVYRHNIPNLVHVGQAEIAEEPNPTLKQFSPLTEIPLIKQVVLNNKPETITKGNSRITSI